MSDLLDIDLLEQPSPIRALHSLRDRQLDLHDLAATLVGPGWSVLRHETYDGHLLVLLCGSDDESWFSLHGAADGVHLGQLRDDRFSEVGVHDSVPAALVAAGEAAAMARPALVA